jgi:stage IV sporulation protein FB
MELGFRLFGLPVRVSLFFFLLGFVIRPAAAHQIPALTAAWLAIMFAGVLLHELGHALTARAFGQQPAILLHGWGGVTYWTPQGTVRAGRRLLISAAGPAVGVSLGLAFLIARAVVTVPGTALYDILDFAVKVNLGWGIFNLVPVLPLDGGQVLASFLEVLGVGNGRRVVHGFSLAIAVVVVVWSIVLFNIWGVLIGGILGYANYLGLRRPPPGPPAEPLSEPPRF